MYQSRSSSDVEYKSTYRSTVPDSLLGQAQGCILLKDNIIMIVNDIDSQRFVHIIVTILLSLAVIIIYSCLSVGRRSPPMAQPHRLENALAFCHTCRIPAIGNGTKTTPKPTASGIGFVMAMDYSDQMTGAARNLMTLQCFVGNHIKNKHVKVVEPFLHPIGSSLGVSLSPSYDKIEPRSTNTVRFSDVFDMEEWRDYYSSREYAQLISWKDFIKNSPKRLILVHHQWVTKNCDQSMINATREFVKENKFKVVRQVCINFHYTGVLSPQKLLDTIYGSFEPNEVVVIFNRWGGFVDYVRNYRFSVRNSTCGGDALLFHPSRQVLSDVEEYSMKYINNTNQYIAVMVRVEYFALNNGFNGLSTEVQHEKLMECFNTINQKVKSVMQEKDIANKLLMMDIGKHGTYFFRTGTGKSSRLDMKALNKAVHQFFEIMYGKSLTQETWEKSYENVARFNAPGYIAFMQKQLAANSTCLLLAGGGSFQGSVKTLYNELHPGAKCVISAC